MHTSKPLSPLRSPGESNELLLMLEPPKLFRIALAVFGCLVPIFGMLIGLGHFLNRHRLPPAPVDAALVFGSGLAWKAQARCATAAELFHHGHVRFLLVSGGVLVPDTQVTEAEWFREQLVAQGVPADCILLESRATNTAENAAFALPIIEAHRFAAVVLVMSDFEGIRAHLTAKRAWRGRAIEIYDYHAPSPGYWSPWTWWCRPAGWRLTCYTLPRLFRYRLWPYLWIRV
jgi:uncharacterized SAM-binding protein YcdF (DUF218 family)